MEVHIFHVSFSFSSIPKTLTSYPPDLPYTVGQKQATSLPLETGENKNEIREILRKAISLLNFPLLFFLDFHLSDYAVLLDIYIYKYFSENTKV